jgi:adenylate cyclase
MAGLALAHLSGELDFAQALIERSLTLNPNSANAWIGSCLLHSYLGNSDTAITHFERAQRLNPLDLSQHLHWNMLAWAHLGAGRYEEAAQAADRTLSVQPDYPAGLRLKAVTYGLLGRTDEARATAGRLLARQPSTTIAWLRVFLQPMLQRNPKALEAYLAGARAAGVPEGT